MTLFFHTAKLVTAECAFASLIFTSFYAAPSLVCVDPKYLNWFTSSSTFSFINMLLYGLSLMLLTKILFLGSWFPYRIHKLFSPAFQWVVAALHRCQKDTVITTMVIGAPRRPRIFLCSICKRARFVSPDSTRIVDYFWCEHLGERVFETEVIFSSCHRCWQLFEYARIHFRWLEHCKPHKIPTVNQHEIIVVIKSNTTGGKGLTTSDPIKCLRMCLTQTRTWVDGPVRISAADCLLVSIIDVERVERVSAVARQSNGGRVVSVGGVRCGVRDIQLRAYHST